jgi:low affinity Fe/Cu permease
VRSHDFFRKFAHTIAGAIGSPYAFLIAALSIVGWAVCGPMFGYSDSWQLVINTGTTIMTFLVVFLIQNTQNRDSQAIHLKLDELIRALKAARNKMLDVETLPDEELARLENEFRQIRMHGERHRRRRHAGYKHRHNHTDKPGRPNAGPPAEQAAERAEQAADRKGTSELTADRLASHDDPRQDDHLDDDLPRRIIPHPDSVKR